MTEKNYNCVLTIAGSDCSGGAGIQADIKAISATGSYAASVITALTAQNTQGVHSILEINKNFVQEQLTAVFSDINVNAVKIGMIANQEIMQVVADTLQKYKPQHVVLDPVMIAKNGSELLKPQAITALKEILFAHATLITPNIPEAEALLKRKIHESAEMEAAAKELSALFNINVLIKGGHHIGNNAADILYHLKASKCYWFDAKRINTKNTHGTGCTLSSAIASYLAQGHTLRDAIQNAKTYLTNAIMTGANLKLGHGFGPVNHFYFLGKEIL